MDAVGAHQHDARMAAGLDRGCVSMSNLFALARKEGGRRMGSRAASGFLSTNSA